ncbi:MAG: signal peptidase II [bacterium]|nr:signal peptidase II [bacterium]
MTFLAAAVAGMATVLAMAAADRAVKIFFLTHPAAGGVVVAGQLQLRLATNPDLAFSLPFPLVLTLALSGAAVVLFVWWLVATIYRRALVPTLALECIVAGAASNLMDRLRWGHVVDYIDVPWFTVFNLADVLITAGVALLVLREVVCWGRSKRKV